MELISQSTSFDTPNVQNFCMARPTIYDVVLNEKKIAGAAQRRKKQGYLHQGTIALALPDEEILRETLQDPEPIIRAMMHYTHVPLKNPTQQELEDARSSIEKILMAHFEKSLGKF